MKNLKLQVSGLIILAACLMIPAQSAAQWSIGASYEIRNEDPQNGFGVRIERDILRPIPIVDIGLRLHGSFFSEENEDTNTDVTTFDYGLAAFGGVSIGLLKPYAGIGVGGNTFDIENGDSETQFIWNSFIGAEITLIPILNPFIEYRFAPTDSPDFAENFNSNGRLILGIILSL